jgi:hypothetical protein
MSSDLFLPLFSFEETENGLQYYLQLKQGHIALFFFLQIFICCLVKAFSLIRISGLGAGL